MDVVIIGGGIVGLTMARLLANNRKMKIALIEPKSPVFSWDPAQYDIRCSAINHATQNILASLDLWDNVLAQRLGFFEEMFVWDQELHQKIEFTATALNVNALGYIVENRILVKTLYESLQQHNNVEIIHATADKIETNNEISYVTIGTRAIECKLIIGADGGNSWVRTQSQIASYGWEYKHSALVATVRTQLAHANIAQQRFMPDGPLAFLPLAEDNLCSIVWSSDPAHIQTLMALDDTEFCARLSQEFAFKLGIVEACGPRACFPLRMIHAQNYIASRVALIGDALHVVHPLAGQGLNLGVLDAAVLAEVLLSAFAQEADIGSRSVLRKYELRRKGHNLSMITLLEGLKRIFATTSKPVSIMRAQGMNLLNNLTIVKNSMMRYAMGLSGDLPMVAKLQP